MLLQSKITPSLRPVPQHPGVSLVELLVSVSVVLVLSAIAFSVLRSSREHSLSSRCMANLRQLHGAYMLWAVDNNGSIPIGYLTADQTDSGKAENISYVTSGYYKLFVTYLNEGPKLDGRPPSSSGYSEPHICPADGPPPTYFGFSYGVNGVMSNNNQNVVSRWTNPSQTFFYADAGSTHYFPANYVERFPGRHGGRDNFIFLDGHIETLSLSDIPSPSPRTGPNSSPFWNAEK